MTPAKRDYPPNLHTLVASTSLREGCKLQPREVIDVPRSLTDRPFRAPRSLAIAVVCICALLSIAAVWLSFRQ